MTISLAAIATQFLDRPGLAKSTQQSYELTLVPLLQAYGRYPIEIVSRPLLEEYLNSLDHLDYTTHHRHQAVIQALLNFAVEQGHLKVNPIAHLRRRKPDATKGEHTSDQIIRYLSEEQLTQFYNVVEVDCRLHALVRLLHRSGARIAEVLALNLKEIDLDKCKFQVVGKGNKRRWCFYSPDAASVLAHYLQYYRHAETAVYQYIDPLFKEVADWKLIQTHWQDLIRVTLSIKAGKLMPSTILRKLGTKSRKNRLYQAFQALGQVVRTLFLLQYISDQVLRQEITACTNVVEGYHYFLDWIFFGKQGVITEHDPEEQEKRLKYLDLVASAVILQNTVDISYAIRALSEEGYPVKRDLLATLSPYLTRHLKRYGDYVVDLGNIPQPLEGAITLPIDIAENQLE